MRFHRLMHPRRLYAPSRPLAALLLLGAFSLLGSAPASAGERDGGAAPDARAGSIETDFLMGMVPHHRGAIMMAEMALRTSQQPELRALAQRIIDDQQREIVLMTGYLRDWYGMAPPEGDMMPHEMMAGMEMPMMRGMMPDMGAQMMALERASGDDFDIAFMSAMISHHSMAIMMAVPVLMAGSHGELRSLAAGIVISQGEEIRQMQEWLAAWYGLDHPVAAPAK